jgi:hypothetical protein
MFGIILLNSVLAAAGMIYEDPEADRLIRVTLQQTYNLQLAQARSAAQTLQTRYSDHPAGFTMMAETYWWEAQMDPGNETIERSYYRLQDIAVKKAEEALKRGKYPRIEILAYLASAHGSYARFQVTQKSAFFSAMRAGLRAHGYAEQVFQMDKTYYDIYVGVGAFNFFTGSLPAVIKPFAFLIGARGDKQLGVQQLNTAMERARYSQTEGRIVYYTAMLEDKNYSRAFSTLERLIADNSDNFVLYTWATDWYRRQSRNLEGADYFERIFNNQIGRSPMMAKYALLEKAQLQQAHNRTAEARATIARLKAIAAGNNPLLSRKVQSFEASLK